jgi:hypothetical protein
MPKTTTVILSDDHYVMLRKKSYQWSKSMSGIIKNALDSYFRNEVDDKQDDENYPQYPPVDLKEAVEHENAMLEPSRGCDLTRIDSINKCSSPATHPFIVPEYMTMLGEGGRTIMLCEKHFKQVTKQML